MSLIKTEQEIAKIRFAAKVVGKILATLKPLVTPQSNGLKLAKKAHQIMQTHDCQPSFLNYQGFPNVICVSVNEQLIHGIPNAKFFQAGDLVSIDVGCQYQGYHADAALTVIVGQSKSKSDSKLLTTTKAALDLIITKLQPGMSIGDVGYLINQVASKERYYVPREYAGHGIGQNLHEDPIIFNYGQPQTGTILKAGMVICVEPMFLQASAQTTVLSDGWTVVSSAQKNSCHFEHTILITATGCEVLSIDH